VSCIHSLETTTVLTEIGGNQLKASQGGKASNGFVQKDGCVAVEPQDLIDGINHPEWGRLSKQISGPDTGPFESSITYKFGTI
jgi:aldose 1-epimerase